MKNRNDLAKYFAEQGFNVGAEVGVLGGTYSTILCQANPNLKLHCVDIWNRSGKYEEAQLRLKDYNVVLIRKLSLEAVKEFVDESLDFVYLDAAHDFDNIMRDIIEWAPKVRRGGIISGHDYGNGKGNGVKDAVNMYAKWHGLTVNILPEPDIRWTPKDPSDEIAGLSWWMQR